MMKTPYLIFALLFSFTLIGKTPRFEMQTIDDEVGIGYGVQLADMNADGKLDVLLVDKDKVAFLGKEIFDCASRSMQERVDEKLDHNLFGEYRYRK